MEQKYGVNERKQGVQLMTNKSKWTKKWRYNEKKVRLD